MFAAFGNLAESGNFVVLAMCCSIWGLYLVMLILARRADKKDELKVSKGLKNFRKEKKLMCSNDKTPDKTLSSRAGEFSRH